ncbi:MAG: hypothetical protein U1E73_01045 [Planctomycetota bacterium]
MKTTVLAVLALAAFATAQQVPDPKTELAKVIAVEEQEGDLAKAEKLYRDALAGTELSMPARAFAQQRLGMLLNKLGRDAEAKPLLDAAKKAGQVVVFLDDVTDEQQVAREKELREQARAIVKKVLEQTRFTAGGPLPGFGDASDANRILWIGPVAVPEVVAALQGLRGKELSDATSRQVAALAGFLWLTGDDASAAFLTSCVDAEPVAFRTAIVENAGLAKSAGMRDVAARFLRDPDPSGEVFGILLYGRQGQGLGQWLDPDLVVDAALQGSTQTLVAMLPWTRLPKVISPQVLSRLHRKVAAMLEGTDPDLGMKLQQFLCSQTSQQSVEGIVMLLRELPKMRGPNLAPIDNDRRFSVAEQAELRTAIDDCVKAMATRGMPSSTSGWLMRLMWVASRDAAPDVAPTLLRWLQSDPGFANLINTIVQMPDLPADLCEGLLAAADTAGSNLSQQFGYALAKTGNPKAADWLLARWRELGMPRQSSWPQGALFELAQRSRDERVLAALRELVAKGGDASALQALFELGDPQALELAPGIGNSQWLASLLDPKADASGKYTDAQIHDLLARIADGKHEEQFANAVFLLPKVPDRHLIAIARLGRWVTAVCDRLGEQDVDAPRKEALRAFCRESLRDGSRARKIMILDHLPGAEFTPLRAEVEQALDSDEHGLAFAAAMFVARAGLLGQREWRHRLFGSRHAIVREIAFGTPPDRFVTAEDAAELLVLLRDASADVRSSAALAAGDLVDVEAVPALIELLRDAEAVVRVRAKDALEKIRFYADQQAHWDRIVKGLDATPASAAEKLLLQAKPDQAREQRLLALQSLGVLGVPEALPFLIEWTHDADAAIQQAAKDAITQIHLHPRR